jgi:hypothetical protein
VEALDRTAARALRQLLETQPLSAAKVEFAWKVAAGPSLARAVTVSWADGRLAIHAKSDQWRREIERARPTILQRLRDLLGADAVHSMTISGDARTAARQTEAWRR